MNELNQMPACSKPLLAEGLQWDDSKAEDKEFLIKWYQSRIEKWEKQPINICLKVIQHYRKGIAELSTTCR